LALAGGIEKTSGVLSTTMATDLSSRILHIVTHDVPWPADYGGVVDLFYKLKALHEQGVNIHLHCFTQGRAPQAELEKYCASVHYYQRNKNWKGISSHLPFIVKSRASSELINRLNQDNHPVLLEGIHTTYHLHTGELRDRKIVVRLHNAEFNYYRKLAQHERHLFKKMYYIRESRLLKKYEQSLAGKAKFIAVSDTDVALYKKTFGVKDIHFLPVFIADTLVTGKEGIGNYCLYHGNLAINENHKAAVWLLEKVFSKINIPLVVTGRNPSPALERLAHRKKNTCLVANPSDAELRDLISRAQVNVLPSFNNTGVKLKLINALCNGRHCLVNEAGVAGSALESACHTTETAEGFCSVILQLYHLPYAEEEIQLRQGLLYHQYNNTMNAKKLMTWIW
jgi:glycosyltransferase involved in cell wall biosynthesis